MTQQKFGRSYRLVIYPIDGGEPIIITMPFTIRFSITREYNSQMNPMSIEILNLSPENRQRLFQDWFDLGYYPDQNGASLGRVDKDGNPRYAFNIILEIGYGTLYRVYYGRMVQASSAREGTNIVTRIECMNGMPDAAGTMVFQTLDSGQTLADVFKFLIGQFPNLKLGAIGNYPTVFYRPITLNGNVWDLLKQYSANQVYVDNGRVYVLSPNEAINTQHIINDESGILSTPRRQQSTLQVQMLLEPGINVMELVKLETTVQPEYNGEYNVLGITHRGTISAAVCEEATTTLTLQAPNRIFGFTRIDVAQGAA
jgi:hypothetical protein